MHREERQRPSFFRGLLDELELMKLPKGVISFPQRLILRPYPENEVRVFRERYGFDELYLIHGVAFESDGHAKILAGAQGTGKSTLLRELVREGSARPIDDGEVLVGRNKATGSLFVVETGFYGVNRTVSLVSKSLRALVGYGSAFALDEGDDRFEGMHKAGTRLARVSRVMGRIIALPSLRRSFEPSVMPLSKIVLLEHLNDPLKPMSLEEEGYRRLSFGQFEACLPESTKLAKIRIPCEDLKQRIRESLGAK